MERKTVKASFSGAMRSMSGILINAKLKNCVCLCENDCPRVASFLHSTLSQAIFKIRKAQQAQSITRAERLGKPNRTQPPKSSPPTSITAAGSAMPSSPGPKGHKTTAPRWQELATPAPPQPAAGGTGDRVRQSGQGSRVRTPAPCAFHSFRHASEAVMAPWVAVGRAQQRRSRG